MKISNEAIFGALNIGKDEFLNHNIVKTNNISENKSGLNQAIFEFFVWMLGIFIAMIPILIVPVFNTLICEDTLDETIFEILQNSDIIFIGITSIVTAVTQFIQRPFKAVDPYWFSFCILIILLTLSGYIMSVIAREFYPKSVDINAVVTVNVILSIMAVLLGGYRHFMEIINNRIEVLKK